MARSGLRGLRVLLASPDDASKEGAIVSSLVERWQDAQMNVRQIALDHSQSDAVLLRQFRIAATQHNDNNEAMVIGGFSVGARLAVMLAPSLAPLAVLAFGFPAHIRGVPRDREGLKYLQRLQTPTLVVQGSRDAHGSESEFRGYAPLPQCVQMLWLSDGNHRWHTKASFEHRRETHLDRAATTSLQFLGNLVSPAQ